MLQMDRKGSNKRLLGGHSYQRIALSGLGWKRARKGRVAPGVVAAGLQQPVSEKGVSRVASTPRCDVQTSPCCHVTWDARSQHVHREIAIVQHYHRDLICNGAKQVTEGAMLAADLSSLYYYSMYMPRYCASPASPRRNLHGLHGKEHSRPRWGCCCKVELQHCTPVTPHVWQALSTVRFDSFLMDCKYHT